MSMTPRARIIQSPTRRVPPPVHPLRHHAVIIRTHSSEDCTRQLFDLGNGRLYKLRPHKHGVFESDIHDLIRSATNIPIPTIYYEWVTTEGSNSSGRGGVHVHHMIMEKVQGEALHNVWPYLNPQDKGRLVSQLINYLNELHRITSPSVCAYNGGPLANDQGFLFDRGYVTQGPLSDEDSIWLAMTHHLQHSPSNTVQQTLINLRAIMPDCLPAVLAHMDLRTSNILVRGGNIVGIVGWEHAAFYPRWMEDVKFRYMRSDPELEFVAAVANCMTAYPAAIRFMGILTALRSTNPQMVDLAIAELRNQT
ncbi:kinase-like protein [Choiromyces venosus 120613-1]|uniref:Kinase-like protein n=1 Tax=Choiromyces venosus 120613-1 TaxID=1336337 RepID=A0A3N4JHP5_9PEZI|nr:kinase-like protein [Choiromyces venosus 120613-1]